MHRPSWDLARQPATVGLSFVFSTHRILSSDQYAARAAPNRLPAALGLVLLLSVPMLFVITIYRTTDHRLLVPGDSAPALSLRDLRSNEMHQAALRERPSAILFFSADCPHCQRELASFDQLQRVHGDQIDFLAVSQSDRAKTMELRQSLGFRVPTMLDEKQEGSGGYGVEVVPALVLVDASGIVAYSRSGELSYAAMQKALLRFLDLHALTEKQ